MKGFFIKKNVMPIVVLIFLILPIITFSQDDRPHVVFLAGEEEYAAHWTLPKIADDLQRRFNIKSTVIHSWRSGAHDYDMPGKVEIPEYEEIENLEIIKEADLLVMHIRFRLPPPEQLQIFQDYFDAGKPAIAFRTTSHGMWAADQKDWFVPFFGGHYKGHMGNSEGTTTLVPAEQLDHPIMRGVPKKNSMNDIMGVYITAPLNETTTILQMGKTGFDGAAQPVTWLNEYQPGQKIFYTSLGGLESFIDPGFINMVYNAIYWTLDRDIPEHGVLGIDNLSFWEKEPPFEKYAFGAIMPNPFERPEEELELENAKILDAEFQPIGKIPSPPKREIPKDATILFDGKDVSKWQHWDLSANPPAMLPDARAVSPSPDFPNPRWRVVDNALEVRPGYGSMLTKEKYGNYKLHLDFLIPEEPDYIPEKYKGSGGIYLDGRYEIKILDSYGKPSTKVSNGSVFKQTAPTSNPSKPTNQWQSMDIEFRNYKGQKPTVSVMLNGEKIHDEVTILGRSPFAIRDESNLFMSSEKEASEIFNMNKNNWTAAIEFRTFGEGYLFSNAPKDAKWNENSNALVIYEGQLIYRNGERYSFVQKEEMPINDEKWHKVVLHSKDGKIKFYVDGKLTNEIENSGATSLKGHVLRLGQGAKIFRLGASDLPDPFEGEIFNGEIKSFRFFNQALNPTEISKIKKGDKMCVMDWKPDTSKSFENIQKGYIRLQSDLSKIRYANIWLQSLKD